MSNLSYQPDVEYRFNLRFFLISTVVIVGVVAGAFGVHYLQADRVADSILARATQLEEEGNNRRASEYLFRYLQMRPLEHEQRAKLAELFGKTAQADQSRYRRAIDLYLDAVALDDYLTRDRIDSMRLALVDLLLQSQRNDEAYREVALIGGDKNLDDLASDLASQTRTADGLSPVVRKALRFRILANARKLARLDDRDARQQESYSKISDQFEAAMIANPADADLALTYANALHTKGDWFSSQKPRQEQRENKADEVMANLLSASTSPTELAAAHLNNFVYRTFPNRTSTNLDEAKRQLDEAIRQASILEDELGPDPVGEVAARDNNDATSNSATTSVPQEVDELESRQRLTVLATFLSAGSFQLDQYDRDIASLNKAPPEATSDASTEGDLQTQDQEPLERLTAAKDYFDRAHQILAKDARPFFGLAEVETRLGGEEHLRAAIDYWDQGLKLEGQLNPEIVSRMIEILTRLEEYDSADQRLTQMASTIESIINAQDVPGEELLQLQDSLTLLRAELLIAEEDFHAAIPRLRDLYSSSRYVGNEDWQYRIASRLAFAYVQIGQADQAAAVFDRAAEQRPDSIETRRSAAEFLLASGNINKALGELEVIAAREGTAQDWYRVAVARYTQITRLPALDRDLSLVWMAIRSAEKKVEDGSMDEPWLLDLLKFDLNVNETATNSPSDPARVEAINSLRELESKFPDSAALARRLVSIYSVYGLSADANRMIDRAKELDPGLDTMRTEATLLASEGKIPAARKLLEEAIEQLEVTANNPEGEVDQTSIAEQRLSLQLGIMGTFVTEDRMQDALDYSKTIETKITSQLVQRIFNLAYSTDYVIEDEEVLKRISDWEGDDGPITNYFVARQALKDREFRSDRIARDRLFLEAAERQSRLASQRPNWSPTYFVRGLLELARNNPNPSEAVSAFRRAISLGDTRGSTYLNLFQALNQDGQFKEAERVLEQFARQLRNSNSLSELAFEMARQQDDLKEAEHLADERLIRDPRDYVALGWKAQVCVVDGRTEEAERYLKQALQFGENDIATWNSLFSFYVAQGRQAEAESHLERLSQRKFQSVGLPSQASFESVLGQGYEILGGPENRQTAEKYYLQAFDSDRENEAIWLRLANFYAVDEPQRAIAFLQKFQPENVGYTRAQYLLATLQGRLGNWPDAEVTLNSVADKGETNVGTIQSNAILRMRQIASMSDVDLQARKLHELHQQVSDYLSSQSASQASDQLLLAAIRLQQSEIPYLSDNSEDVSRKYQHWQDSLSYAEDAVQLYAKVCERPDVDIGSLRTLCQLHIQLYDRIKARLESLPNDIELPEPLKEFPVRLISHRDDADSRLTQLEERSQFDPTDQALRIRWYRAQDRLADAAEYVKQTLAESLQRLSAQGLDNKESKGTLHGIAAQFYSVIDQPESAEQEARRAFDLDKSNVTILAGVLSENGKLAESIDLLGNAYHSETDRAQRMIIANRLVTVLLNTAADEAAFSKANPLIDEALNEFANEAVLLTNIGSVRVVQNRDDESFDLYKRALSLAPNNVVVLNNYATMLSERESLDKRQEALELINRAIFLRGELAALLDTKGTALLKLDDKDKAVETLKLAARKPNADARVHFHLALAYQASGKRDLARQSLERALLERLDDQVLTSADKQARSELEQWLEDGDS